MLAGISPRHRRFGKKNGALRRRLRDHGGAEDRGKPTFGRRGFRLGPERDSGLVFPGEGISTVSGRARGVSLPLALQSH